MTLCMAAKFKDGILCATDLAISSGSAKREMTDGKWFNIPSGLCLYAGTLYYVQEVAFTEGHLRDRLIEVHEKHKDDDDDDACELLHVHMGEITYFEHYGSFYDCGDYGCVGNGSDLADALLRMVYTPGRSEAWLHAHFKNIFEIVSEKVDGVSRKAMYKVIK